MNVNQRETGQPSAERVDAVPGISGIIRRISVSRGLYLCVRIALALLFIYAGALKLTDVHAFARTISHYGLVPDALLPVIAFGLPAIEVLSGLALIFDLRAGLYSISGLLVLFVGVLGYGVLNDMNIDCGCFGPEELAEKKGLAHAFYRDLVLIGVVAFLYWSRIVRRRRSASDKVVKNLINTRRK